MKGERIFRTQNGYATKTDHRIATNSKLAKFTNRMLSPAGKKNCVAMPVTIKYLTLLTFPLQTGIGPSSLMRNKCFYAICALSLRKFSENTWTYALLWPREVCPRIWVHIASDHKAVRLGRLISIKITEVRHTRTLRPTPPDPAWAGCGYGPFLRARSHESNVLRD